MICQTSTVHIFDRDSKGGGGYQNFTESPRGGGVSIFTHTKKETEQSKISKISLSCNSPRRPGCNSPLLPWKTSGTLVEGTHFWQRLRGEGMHFLWALFPTRNSEQSLIYKDPLESFEIYLKWHLVMNLGQNINLVKGTVPPSSGTRISRLTQGPLMSSCKHFKWRHNCKAA